MMDLLLSLYRRALKAFPTDFRARFGRDMTEVLADRLRLARSAGRWTVIRIWMRAIRDVAVSGLAERRATRARARRPAANLSAGPRSTSMIWPLAIDSMRQNLRSALRTFRARPGFVTVVMLTLALGIGAATAVFSVTRALLFQPLPFPAADRLVAISNPIPSEDDFAGLTAIFEQHGLLMSDSLNLASGDQTTRAAAGVATPELFALLGVQPAAGRLFTAGEALAGPAPAVLVSERVAVRLFGSPGPAVGRMMVLDSVTSRVAGVVPDIAGFPAVDVWTLYDDAHLPKSGFNRRALARLRPGITIEAANRALPRSGRVGRTPRVQSLRDTRSEDIGIILSCAAGLVAIILALVCVNITNLSLSLNLDRGREYFVRAALGASRGALIRQTLTESMLLAIGGAIAGLIVAVWGIQLLVYFLGDGLELAMWHRPRIDAVGLVFALGVAIVTGVGFGAVPAIASGRARALDRHRHEGVTPPPVKRRARSVFVVAQTSLAATLLVTAGLFLSTVYRARQVGPGFDPAGLVMFRVALPPQTYSDAPSIQIAMTRLLEQLRQTPEVADVAAANAMPLGRSFGFIELDVPAPLRSSISSAAVSPGYFGAVGLRLTQGRDFANGDAASTIIVSESVAAALWPSQQAIGRVLRTTGGPNQKTYDVIGVVSEVVPSRVDRQPQPAVYLPLAHQLSNHLAFVTRVRGAGFTAPAAARAVARVDATLAVHDFRTMEDELAGAFADLRFVTVTFEGLGALVLLLASLGVYGVMASAVVERTREIGIRLALGAPTTRIIGTVLRPAARLTIAGGAIGLAAGLGVIQVLRSELYGVGVVEPVVIGSAVTLLAIVVLAAAWVPARRALRIDPIQAIK
jgi:putative ABC transport system permease protein